MLFYKSHNIYYEKYYKKLRTNTFFTFFRNNSRYTHIIELKRTRDQRIAFNKEHYYQELSLFPNRSYTEQEMDIKIKRLAAKLSVECEEAIKALKQAYPSYFLDAELFIRQIHSVKRKLEKMQRSILI